ncbi:MAG: hypothetical protein ACXADC_01795 [Candidatus Thorarchaeota archaeon]|jgi:putative effector of murein hydrolase LrgA (UPF0299 family)
MRKHDNKYDMDEVEIRHFIRYLLIIEVLLFIPGGVLVTNMHPVWMQQIVYVLFLSIIATGTTYVLVSRRIKRY